LAKLKVDHRVLKTQDWTYAA